MNRRPTTLAALLGAAVFVAVLTLSAAPTGVRAQTDADSHDDDHSSGSETPDVYNCSCNALAEHEAEEAAAAVLAATCATELADWEADNHSSHETTAAEWVSGLAASIVISLVSLIGVGTFSFVPVAHRDHALQALLGLAFGTLVGGTFLDLLPETAEELGKFDTGVSAVCMCGIIFGYLTERLTHWVSGGTHSHSHGGDGGSAGHGHGHSHAGGAAHPDDAPGGHGNVHDHDHAHHPHKPMAQDGMGTAHKATHNGPANGTGSGDVEMRAVKVVGTLSAAPASDDPLAFPRIADPHLSAAAPAVHIAAQPATSNGQVVVASGSGDKKDDDITRVATSASEFKPNHLGTRGGSLFGLTPLAILSLSGDAIHNFIDGLVVGAAFVTSINTGVVTAVAVAVHEIPQEIGDFGILLQSGLTVKQALFANFAVACTCIAGTVITLALGEQMGSNANYALPFAGGVFLYLALSGVVPEIQRYIAAEDRDEVERRETGRPSGRLSCCGGSLVLSMTWLAAWGIGIGIALMGLLTLLPHEHGGGTYEPSEQCATVNAAASDGHHHH